MALSKLYNLARMTTATTGTGTITLGAAVSGFLSFSSAGAQDGDLVAYGISDGANSEVGTGTYTAIGTTLTRTVTQSTNSNSAISLSGSAQVFITALAPNFALVDRSSGTSTTLYGGTAAGSALSLASTSAAGTSDHISFLTGSQVEAARFDTNQRYLQGLTAALSVGGGGGGSGVIPNWQMAGSNSAAAFGMLRYTAPGGGGPLFELGSSRGAAPGTFSAVQLGDGLGTFQFFGDNGTDYTGTAAVVQALADGNFTPTSMPGKLAFRTTKPGATNITTALTIDSGQNVVVGQGAALATNATLGFFYIETCAGAPTGTPATSYAGSLPLIYDTTNHKLWIFDTTWKGVVLS